MADRQKAIEAFIRCGTPGVCSDKCAYFSEGFNCYRAMKHDLLELLKEQPEQKHGHWKRVEEGFTDMMCSECGELALLDLDRDFVLSKFCPNCGTRMDEEVEQE